MANTFTQIHIQVVFAVRFRAAQIEVEWKDELYKYITGIIQSQNHKVLAIDGMPDHLHILFGMRPTQSLSDLMQNVKSGSSTWINERSFVDHKFLWQEGYGAFSYSKSEVPDVIRYIRNQEIHHRQTNFLDEYKKMLDEFGISFDERYVFRSLE